MKEEFGTTAAVSKDSKRSSLPSKSLIKKDSTESLEADDGQCIRFCLFSSTSKWIPRWFPGGLPGGGCGHGGPSQVSKLSVRVGHIVYSCASFKVLQIWFQYFFSSGQTEGEVEAR